MNLETVSNDELMPLFKKAESEDDDITCLAILDEVKRRKLVLMDK